MSGNQLEQIDEAFPLPTSPTSCPSPSYARMGSSQCRSPARGARRSLLYTGACPRTPSSRQQARPSRKHHWLSGCGHTTLCGKACILLLLSIIGHFVSAMLSSVKSEYENKVQVLRTEINVEKEKLSKLVFELMRTREQLLQCGINATMMEGA